MGIAGVDFVRHCHQRSGRRRGLPLIWFFISQYSSMALLNVVILCLQALAALRLDMTSEVATGKTKITGPRPGPFGTHPVQDALSIIIFVGFLLLFLAGFLRALQPSLRLTNMKARQGRQRWMLNPSRSGHPAKAKTLRDLWSESR